MGVIDEVNNLLILSRLNLINFVAYLKNRQKQIYG